MKPFSLLLCSLMMLLMTAMPVVANQALPKPGAISEEEIFLTERLSTKYDTLVIKEFSEEGVEYSRVNDEEKVKILQMLPLLKSNIALTLEAELKAKNIFKSIVRDGAVPERSVVLEGRFSEFNAGSKALKFFVGFGSGKVYIKFKGRLIDGTDGTVLATFEDRQTGYRGSMTLEGFESLFPHQAKGIGENLANFLEKLY